MALLGALCKWWRIAPTAVYAEEYTDVDGRVTWRVYGDAWKEQLLYSMDDAEFHEQHSTAVQT